MSNITQATAYTKIKQPTDHDARNLGPLVSGYEAQASTLNQTVITLTKIVCNLDRKSTVMIYVDGQLLTEGVGNDYVWINTLNNTSSQLTLASPLSAGLNILAYKIGVAPTPVASAETIQATVNLVSNQVDQKNASKVMNGNFDFWQRGTSFVSVANGAYTADRFSYFKSGVMVHNISRSTDVPSLSSNAYSMLIDCTTLDNAIAASEYTFVAQKIEGNVLKTFKNKSMVLAFWVKSPKTGVHCVAFENGTQTRSIVKEYTVNAANTWERKVIRFQHDPTGTWDYSTGIGMWVIWTLAAGTTFQSTANTWQNGVFIATVNQVNVCDSAANDFLLSDVVLTEDNDTLSKIPDFCFAARNYAEELQLCQRYYEKNTDFDAAYGVANGEGGHIFNSFIARAAIQWKVPKRVTAPTVTFTSPFDGAVGFYWNRGAANASSSNQTIVNIASYKGYFIVGLNAYTSDHWAYFNFYVDAEL